MTTKVGIRSYPALRINKNIDFYKKILYNINVINEGE